MPALAIAPADLSPAAPQSTASSATGNEGLFASHLRNAADQQTATASAQTDAKHARNRHVKHASQGAKKISMAHGDSPVAAASLSGVTETMIPQPAPAIPADTASPDNMMADPRATGQGRESAVTRLLARLTAGNSGIPASVPSSAQQPAGRPDIDSAPVMPHASEHPNGPDAAVSAARSKISGRRSGAVPAQTAGLTIHHAGKGAKPPQGIAAALTGQQADGQMQANTAMTIQNRRGQFIAIHFEQTAAEDIETGGRPGSATATSDSRKVDVNGNYIRSRLPKEPVNTTPEPEKIHREDDALQARQQKLTTSADLVQSTADMLQKPPAATGQETAPLSFAVQPQALGQPAAITPIASVALQLPSGITVPDTAVVDQIFAHFSASTHLKNGMVTLRLYPEELGALRMEIKVTQDTIKAHIVAQTAQAQEMINRHLPRLHEALEQQGLHLLQVEVSVAAHNQTGGERFQENHNWRQSAHSVSHAASQPDCTQESDDITGNDSTNGSLSVLV